MEKKQTIKCNVEGCEHINDDATYCTLEEIQISCDTDEPADCSDKDETLCDSYDPKDIDEDDENDQGEDEEDNK